MKIQSTKFLIAGLIAGSLVGTANINAQDYTAATSRIQESDIRGNIRFLSDDLLEGRGPGTNGDALAQLYIESQFQALGLKPLASLGQYRQSVPMFGVTSRPDTNWQFRKGNSTSDDLRFTYFDEFIAVAGRPETTIKIDDREVVFVGYGIQAPEFQWDDYKGVDLKGKILLMMNNDPENDPELFGGSRRMYYGRWDYKYDSAARQGAAGAIIIHTTPSAGYPFTVIQTSWTGEESELRESTGPRIDMKGWMTDAATKRLVASAGFDLDDLRKSAESREFRPVPLRLTLSTKINAEVRQRETANVISLLPGSDPKLSEEYVMFMAHHDHIGIAADRDARGDNIFNGAIDNASGTATLLSIAKAIAASGLKPKRSILFAAVGAEEQGLLGSKYLAEHPVVSNGKISALINMDGINFLGPTQDVQVIGLGKSSLDTLVDAIAKKQNRTVVGDLEPSKGFYYRSDQFSLAKVGVPAVYLHGGHAVRNKPEGWGKEQLAQWTEKHYHQRSDEYDPNWNLEGCVEDTRLLAEVGLIAADSAEMQQWKAGDEFEAARKSAIQQVGMKSTWPEVQTAEWAVRWWMPRHQSKLAEKSNLDACQLVWIGDSITHGWDNTGKEIWDAKYAKYQPLNLGFSGDRTEQVLWRLNHGAVDGISPKVAVIMIGTNNAGHRTDPANETAAGVEAIIKELRTRLPKSKLLLLGIFPRGANSDDPLRKLNRITNELISKLGDNKQVYFFDIGEKFLNADGTMPTDIMPDLLHPNKKGYEIWSESIDKKLQELMR